MHPKPFPAVSNGIARRERPMCRSGWCRWRKRHDTQVVPYGAIPILRGRVEHVFNEDTISGSWIVDKDMGDGADQFAILDDGTAAHADVK